MLSDPLYSHVRHEQEDMRAEQLAAVDFLYDNPFSALFADVGMGKAIISLTVMLKVIARLQLRLGSKVLIVAPIRVAIQTWPTEVKEWRHTAHLTHTVLRVSDDDPEIKAYSRQAFQESRDAGLSPAGARARADRIGTIEKDRRRRALVDSNAVIHIIDKGSVDWLVKECTRRGHWPYRVLFVDESSCLGDHGSEIFKALKDVRAYLDRFHQLTATPAAQTYMKFFSMIWLLDKGKRLGSYITHYRERYFDYNPYRRTWSLKPGAAEQIEGAIADICLVMRKNRGEDEKPLVLRRPVLLTDDQADAYRRFETSYVLDLPSGEEIEAQTAAALSQKLLQCASGAVYDQERRVHAFHEQKIEELRQLQDELQGEQLLVAYWFKSSLARLQKAFPKAATMDAEGKLVKSWNDRKLGMLFIHPQSAGHGLNMQFGGHHLACFDLFWALELFLQVIGRLDRPGQDSQVKVHLLTALGTHDEAVADNLVRLESAQEAMYQRLQAIRRRQLGT